MNYWKIGVWLPITPEEGVRMINHIQCSVLAVALMMAACQGNDFSGGGNAPAAKAPQKNLKNGDATGDNGDPLKSDIDGGGDLTECSKGTMIEDPNAAFTFAPGEGKAFINSLGNITPIPVAAWNTGSIHADQASVDATCQLKGYVRAESFTAKGYYSCHDNTHGYWNSGIKNFEIKSACVNNSSAQIIVCKGKLKDPCEKDKSWIFKK
jgi:hypothetical protein